MKKKTLTYYELEDIDGEIAVTASIAGGRVYLNLFGDGGPATDDSFSVALSLRGLKLTLERALRATDEKQYIVSWDWRGKNTLYVHPSGGEFAHGMWNDEVFSDKPYMVYAASCNAIFAFSFAEVADFLNRVLRPAIAKGA